MLLNNRVIAALALVIFMTVLAIVIGQQLAEQAMSILLGILAGILVSVPTSAVVAWAAVRTLQQRAERSSDSYFYAPPPTMGTPTYPMAHPSQQAMPPGYPPVYWQSNTVNAAPWQQPQLPATLQAYPNGWQPPQPAAPPSPIRQFQVIGGGSIEES